MPSIPKLWHLARAVHTVSCGGVIAYPTEAVYGLGCLPDDPAAIARILTLKRRSIAKGLILVAAEVGQLSGYVDFPDRATRQRVLATWPGPVTWVLPARSGVSRWIRGHHDSIAVRVSSHPVVASLCSHLGPLVSTSANPAHSPPARTAHKVRYYFGQTVDYILPGAVGKNPRPTEIRNASTGRILRPGSC